MLVGYEVYLVGGCVRDLILKRTPKDFDIITTAELREVVVNGPFFFSCYFDLIACLLKVLCCVLFVLNGIYSWRIDMLIAKI